MHFRQKRIVQSLDYAALRPVSVVFAPFFFCIYLPRMGIQLPNIDPPDVDWPDIDWCVQDSARDIACAHV